MSVELDRVGWEDGTLVTPARVTTPTGTYDVTEATYSGETPLSAQNLKAMEDNAENAINALLEILSPQSIYCTTSADNNMSANYTDISNWVSRYNIGDSFEVSSGKIKVGANVNHVRVFVKFELEIINAGTFYSYIRKNSSNLGGSWIINKTPTGNYILTNFTVVAVEQNDIITTSHYFSTTGNDLRGTETAILVEKID